MIPIVLLAKKLAVLITHAINVIGAPEALGGILVAVLVLSPRLSAQPEPLGTTTCNEPSTSVSAQRWQPSA